MGEILSNHVSCKGLVYGIYQELSGSIKKNNLKMGKRFE